MSRDLRIVGQLVLLIIAIFSLKNGVTLRERVVVQEVKIYPDTVYIDTSTVPADTDILNAILHVESRGKNWALNTSSNAVGCLQIRPIMVKEVNRICKILGMSQRFTMGDRWSRKQSFEMFRLWRMFHHKKSSYEKIARNWNGGPGGYKNPETLRYWNDVKRKLE